MLKLSQLIKLIQNVIKILVDKALSQSKSQSKGDL